MHFALPFVLVGATSLIPVADAVPNFNVAPSCQAASSIGWGGGQSFKSCMDDERSARRQLVRRWGSYPAGNRAECVSETQDGGTPSYVEVLTCLQMDQDVASDTPSAGKRRKSR